MGSSPFSKIKEIPLAVSPVPFGDIQPDGWLKDELRRNLAGFTGQLDSLVPELFSRDDIYGKDRLKKEIRHKDVGALSDDGAFQTQFLWWNSETQSNWLDGFIRTAALLHDKTQLKKVKWLTDWLLSTQDPDGYLGIYDKELRYHFNNENGELWSKTTLYRALLGWYEFTKDKNVLGAIEKAVADVMSHYPVNASRPFRSENPNAGGVTHGLAFTDVLERLYQLTGKKVYADYIVFLYKNFSEETLNEDAQFAKLMDPEKSLMGHGVHVYEHLRSIAAAYQISGNPSLKHALDLFLVKIGVELNPSGGPAGDEFIGGRKADATETGYEFCSLHELMSGWISLFSKTGSTEYGDRAEQLYFNAAMGAVHPEESAICYLKTDNALYLTGGKHGDTTDKNQTRYRYSPVHKEAAVCCVPNAGRIGPEYIGHMWMSDQEGLIATLFGPCTINTSVRGKEIRITEVTSYPFEHHIRFLISAREAHSTTIKVRRPAWATGVLASAPYSESGGFLVFKKSWKQEDELEISFQTATSTKLTRTGQVYFMNGPLVLCNPVEGVQKITKVYPVSELRESVYYPVSTAAWQYNDQAVSQPDPQKMEFNTQMYDPASGKTGMVKLVPMFHTILRRVTFDVKH